MNERKLKKQLRCDADRLLESKKEALTAFYRPIPQKKTVGRLPRRLALAAVCAALLAVLFAFLAPQTDAPGVSGGASSAHSVSAEEQSGAESGSTEESRETSEPAKPNGDDAYCGIVPADLPSGNADVSDWMNVTDSMSFGSALQAKMQLYADEEDYRFHVVVYSADDLRETSFSAMDQAVLLQFSVEDWVNVEWMEDAEAYYCRLTADELYALHSCGITCLYVGSGKAESSQTDLRLQNIECRLEKYGDSLIGITAGGKGE